jgi:hypothetical protein
MHGVHATVHENGPKHIPNMVFDHLQLVECVDKD